MFTFRIRRFLSENLIALTLSAILFVSIASQAWLLYTRSREVMHSQLDSQLRTAAALAAKQFTGEELDVVTGRSSMDTPLFADMVTRLKDIRSTVPNIQYVYIMRKTENPMELEFVADADALATFAEMDLNTNGIIDPDEEGSYPGDRYAVDGVPAMQGPAFKKPTVDQDITVDQWGELISGYAPIYRSNGSVAGIIGLDMDAREFVLLSEEAFSGYALVTTLIIGVAIVLSTLYIIWERRMAALSMLDRERAALLALTTHQLGGPVSSIRWWVEMMKDEGECDKESACGHIETSVEKINTIVQDLIDVERQEHGRILYKKQPCNVKQLIEEAVERVGSNLKEHHDIEVHVDPALNAQLDPKLIGSVITELIENAMWYSDEGTSVLVSAKRGKRFLDISVEDNGMGIDKRDRDRIFDKLTRGSNAARYRPNGSGLGLYVVKLIMRKAKGQVKLTSVPGKGSTFTIKIPK